MPQAVETPNDEATSSDVEINVAPQVVQDDPFMAIMAGLEEADAANQPTLDAEVEETPEDQDDDPADDESVNPDEPIEDDPGEPDTEEEDEDDATSDDDEFETVEEDDEEEYEYEDVDEDEPEDEEPGYFFVGNHSEYETAEQARKGIEVKDAYIIDLEAADEESKAEIANLKARLSTFTSAITEDALKAVAIQSLLPEEFQGKTEEDFEDAAEIRAFMTATIKAEAQFERQRDEAEREARDQADVRDKRMKSAAKFVRDTATTGFFGITKPEERGELRKLLTTKNDSGQTALDRARFITEAFGEEDGLRYLEGLRLQIQGEEDGNAETPPEAKPTKTTAKKRKRKRVAKAPTANPKVIERIKKTRVKKRTSVTPPPQQKPRDEFKGKDAVDMIAAGLG